MPKDRKERGSLDVYNWLKKENTENAGKPEKKKEEEEEKEKEMVIYPLIFQVLNLVLNY